MYYLSDFERVRIRWVFYNSNRLWCFPNVLLYQNIHRCGITKRIITLASHVLHRHHQIVGWILSGIQLLRPCRKQRRREKGMSLETWDPSSFLWPRLFRECFPWLTLQGKRYCPCFVVDLKVHDIINFGKLNGNLIEKLAIGSGRIIQVCGIDIHEGPSCWTNQSRWTKTVIENQPTNHLWLLKADMK